MSFLRQEDCVFSPNMSFYMNLLDDLSEDENEIRKVVDFFTSDSIISSGTAANILGKIINDYPKRGELVIKIIESLCFKQVFFSIMDMVDIFNKRIFDRLSREAKIRTEKVLHVLSFVKRSDNSSKTSKKDMNKRQSFPIPVPQTGYIDREMNDKKRIKSFFAASTKNGFNPNNYNIFSCIRNLNNTVYFIRGLESFKSPSSNGFLHVYKVLTENQVLIYNIALSRDWKYKKKQFAFIEYVLTQNSSLLYSKNSQSSPYKVDSSYNEKIWRNYDLIEIFSYLYDFIPSEIQNFILGHKCIPTILIFLSEINKLKSNFVTYLYEKALYDMQCSFSLNSIIWLQNEEFAVDIAKALYFLNPFSLGKLYDAIVNSNKLEYFINNSKNETILCVFRIYSFIRTGRSFIDVVKKLSNVSIILKILSSPGNYGFSIPLNIKRKVNNTYESAEGLVFSYFDGIYERLNPETITLILSLYLKSLNRSNNPLTGNSYKWTANKGGNIGVDDDKESIEKLGMDFGVELCKNSQDRQVVTEKMSRLFVCMRSDTESDDFQFGKSAFQYISNYVNMFPDYHKKFISIFTNENVRKHIPSLFTGVTNLLNPIRAPQKILKDLLSKRNRVKLHIHPKITIFESIKHSPFQLSDKDYVFFHSFLEHLPKTQLTNQHFEVASYHVIRLLRSETDYKSCGLMSRLGDWFNKNAIREMKPYHLKFLDISELLMYAYENSKLFMFVPFLFNLFSEVPLVFHPPCPYFVNILSHLEGIARLPFLRKSLFEMISGIFSVFNTTFEDIAPAKIHLFDEIPKTDCDFLFPPINILKFTNDPLSLYLGDFQSIRNYVHMFLYNVSDEEVDDICNFILDQVPKISKSVMKTIKVLILKDFSRSSDTQAMKIFANSMISNLVDHLLWTRIRNKFQGYISKQNIRFVKHFVSYISEAKVVQLLSEEMDIQENIRVFCGSEPFMDLHYSPRWNSNQIPAKLIPYSNYGSSIEHSYDQNSIYGCYSVPFTLKKAYAKFSSVVIDQPIFNLKNVDAEFSSMICDTFVYDYPSNKPTECNLLNFTLPEELSKINQMHCIVRCIKPWFEIDIVKAFIDSIDDIVLSEEDLLLILSNEIPHISLLFYFVNSGMLSPVYIEPLIIRYIDEYGFRYVDLSPIVEELESHPQYTRLLEILGIKDRRYMTMYIEKGAFSMQSKSNNRVSLITPRKLYNEINKAGDLKNIIKIMYQKLSRKEVYKETFMDTLIAIMNMDNSDDHLIFGGFLRDLSPQIADHKEFSKNNYDLSNVKVEFTSLFLYYFGAVVPHLISGFTSQICTIVESLLSVFRDFPQNWEFLEHYVVLYKAVLRLLLLISHDNINFMRKFRFRFLYTVPLEFRRLRNIILCSSPVMEHGSDLGPQDRVEMIMRFNLKGEGNYSRLLSNILEYCKICDRPKLYNNLNTITRSYLTVKQSSYEVKCFIEALFDFISNGSHDYTPIFVRLIDNAYRELKFTYEGVSLQQLIRVVYKQRCCTIKPVPKGLDLIKIED